MKIICLILFEIFVVTTQPSTEISVLNKRTDVDYGLVESNEGKTHNLRNIHQSFARLVDFKSAESPSIRGMPGSEVSQMEYKSCNSRETFDTTTGQCRELSCQEANYKFNGTTCIPDESKTDTNIYKPMSNIDLSVIVNFLPTNHIEAHTSNFLKRLNRQINGPCNHDWANMFHDAIHELLMIDHYRITNIMYKMNEQDDKILQTQLKMNSKSMNNILEQDDAEFLFDPESLLFDSINECLYSNASIVINFNFSITDKSETSDDKLNSLDVVTRILIASELHLIMNLHEKYSMNIEKVSIISDKNVTRNEFCVYPDEMYQTENATIRANVRSNGDIDYAVYVPELETTYEVGDYVYTSLISTSPVPPPVSTRHVITSGPSSSTSAAVSMTVCNRHPRIVDRCPNSLVMSIALCEVDKYKNFSIKIKHTDRIYTNRQYRYANYRPDLNVVVCNDNAYNGTTDEAGSNFYDKATGLVSTIAIFSSICALFITLITFLLFPSLRNLPGCNMMNLIVALLLADILFLLQSLLTMNTRSVCLIFALGIHFFFLASFFWMNVMAFDLWKTFQGGVALYIYEVRERLFYYALYGWSMPAIIVLIGVLLDVKNAQYKPCYGRYFPGCTDVCFHTQNNASLQGCWIESALMRFLLFGVPIAIILIINFIFYTLTVRSIRHRFKSIRAKIERKFQQKKQVEPGVHDVKIYMRMAFLAGFGWVIGFILFALSDDDHGIQYYLIRIFNFLFILLNATPGIFIFYVYVCDRRVFDLYSHLFTKLFPFTQLKHRTNPLLNKVNHILNRKSRQDTETTQDY